jgi:predicted O-methyltransferase YrrM
MKPKTVFEVGTWYGGGSTYFISHALHENDCGILHTIEADPQVHSIAVENYRRYLPHLLPHVRFHLGRAREIYPSLLRECGKVDAVFLDGAPDARETLGEFEMFAPHLASRSIVLMHDWDNDKMALLRPRMEKSADWVLQRTITTPHSVGFAVWIHA